MRIDRDQSHSFQQVVTDRLSRRGFLLGSAGVLSALAMPGLSGSSLVESAKAAGAASSLTFKELKRSVQDTHAVAEGYKVQVVAAWGDALAPGLPAFDANTLDAASQLQRFGYNNDFIAFMPLPKGSASPDHGLLCVNHEYVSPQIMFPGMGEDDAGKKMTKEQVALCSAAVGHSVVEIKNVSGEWKIIAESTFNRRIHMDTEMALSGPVAGHAWLKTSADPTGTKVRGMIYNCAGGVTPWDTVLSCEEGASDTFGGDPSKQPNADYFKRYGYDGSDVYGRARFDDRFNIDKEPNEANRFDWVVEIDPYDPTSMPVKRTALGRFGHEGATVVENGDGRIVVYMGDDDYFEYIYRYVSNGKFDRAKPETAKGLLDDGVLSVARFDADGTVTWLPLVHGQGPLTAANGFADQADVLLKARLAGDALKATPMDRPEDMETNQVTGRVYAVLTKNKKRKADNLNAPNMRAENKWGQIIEMIPPGGVGPAADHTAASYKWEIFVQCGNPADPKTGATFHKDTSADGWFVTPDNIAFDMAGNIWVATDGANDFDLPDGIYAMATEGPTRGLPKLLFACPHGAEATGPAFSPQGDTLFVSVQHPAEDSESLDKLTTRWPDFKDGQTARPAVVAISPKQDGVVGS